MRILLILMMTKRILLAALLLGWSLPAEAQLRYTVDLNDPATHRATITLQVDSIPARDSIFQFAATAPGTYQTIGLALPAGGAPDHRHADCGRRAGAHRGALAVAGRPASPV